MGGPGKPLRQDRRDPFAAARRRGAADYFAGKRETENPYVDIRNTRGAVTYARAWVKSWAEGYNEARKSDLPNYGHGRTRY